MIKIPVGRWSDLQKGYEMKRFRVVYWFNSIITEKIVRAESVDDVYARFADRHVVKVEEVE